MSEFTHTFDNITDTHRRMLEQPMLFTSGPDLQLITAVKHYREDVKNLKYSQTLTN